MKECYFLSFDNCIMVMQDVNIRGSWANGLGELYIILQLLWKPKIISK